VSEAAGGKLGVVLFAAFEDMEAIWQREVFVGFQVEVDGDCVGVDAVLGLRPVMARLRP
jgi:hypothetical protein